MGAKGIAVGLGVVGMGLLGVVGAPGVAYADEYTCRNKTIGAITVDNVRVAAGKWCKLSGTKVKGTVKVQRNAGVTINRARINGNVQAENARNVVIGTNTRVGGSVQVKQGGGANVTKSVISGDIQYDANRRFLVASNNRVGGNVQVMSNRGGVRVKGNRIDGNLQCKSNNPRPVGGGNIVKGDKEGQCARL